MSPQPEMQPALLRQYPATSSRPARNVAPHERIYLYRGHLFAIEYQPATRRWYAADGSAWQTVGDARNRGRALVDQGFKS